MAPAPHDQPAQNGRATNSTVHRLSNRAAERLRAAGRGVPWATTGGTFTAA